MSILYENCAFNTIGHWDKQIKTSENEREKKEEKTSFHDLQYSGCLATVMSPGQLNWANVIICQNNHITTSKEVLNNY